MKKRIVIVGAGFAGLAATRALASCAEETSLRLFDARPHTTMLPSLPDLAGGQYAQQYLTGDIEPLLPQGAMFHRERVTALDLHQRKVAAGEKEYSYDHLVVAAGGVTNLFGFDQHLEAVHTLDSVDDASRIRDAFSEYLRRADPATAVVVGGGYTGLELAGNLRVAARAAGRPARVCVLERKERILDTMPDWVRDYLREQAVRHEVELIEGVSVQQFDGRRATLSDGSGVDDVFLCWATGRKASIEDIRGRHECMRDGRLKVDACLRVPEHPEVYAAGDAAAMQGRDGILRLAVNFARDSGLRAGRNVRGVLRGRPPMPFRPLDLGWVIPFVDVGVGEIFGRLQVRGKFSLALHYAMCGLRNYSGRNRLFYWRRAVGRLLARVPESVTRGRS